MYGPSRTTMLKQQRKLRSDIQPGIDLKIVAVQIREGIKEY